MEYLKAGVTGTIMTPNEARRKLDMEDKEAGDELYANGNIISLTQAGIAYQKNMDQKEGE